MTGTMFDARDHLFNHAAVPVALACLATLAGGWHALRGERRWALARALAVLCASLVLWLAASAWLLCAVREPAATWWARMVCLSLPFVPVACAQAALTMFRVSAARRRMLWVWWLLAAALALSAAVGDGLVRGVSAFGWGYYPRYGWLGAALAAHCLGAWIAMAVSLWGTWREMPSQSPQRARLAALAAAAVLLPLAGIDLLARAHEQLERSVLERTAQLRQLNDALQQEIAQHQRAKRRLALQDKTATVLAHAPRAEDAITTLLAQIGEQLDASLGACWMLDRAAGALRCHRTWRAASLVGQKLEQASHRTTYMPGIGLPGRV